MGNGALQGVGACTSRAICSLQAPNEAVKLLARKHWQVRSFPCFNERINNSL